jgi:hypothetical protein
MAETYFLKKLAIHDTSFCLYMQHLWKLFHRNNPMVSWKLWKDLTEQTPEHGSLIHQTTRIAP